MQIQKVNSNYNYKNNQQPAFKGLAEQELFMKMVETPELLSVARNVIATGNEQSFVDYFARTFAKLREAFAGRKFEISDETVHNTQIFKFTNPVKGEEPENIQISFESGRDYVIRYEEQQLLPNERTKQTTHIDYDNISNEPEESAALVRSCQIETVDSVTNDNLSDSFNTDFLNLRTNNFGGTISEETF